MHWKGYPTSRGPSYGAAAFVTDNNRPQPLWQRPPSRLANRFWTPSEALALVEETTCQQAAPLGLTKMRVAPLYWVGLGGGGGAKSLREY